MKNIDAFKDAEAFQKHIEGYFGEDFIEEAHERAHEFAKMMSYYRCAMMEIETKFNVLNEEFSLRFDRNPISDIKSRIKSMFSIREKLLGRGFPFTMEAMEKNLHDIAGVRVICSFPQDVYMLADALLKQDDICLIEKKDYIKHPKANGYRSLHLIVTVPIFWRTRKGKCVLKFSCARLRWIFGRAWSISCDIKKIFCSARRWQRSFCNARI